MVGIYIERKKGIKKERPSEKASLKKNPIGLPLTIWEDKMDENQ
jgi:hypothetical protein